MAPSVAYGSEWGVGRRIRHRLITSSSFSYHWHPVEGQTSWPTSQQPLLLPFMGTDGESSEANNQPPCVFFLYAGELRIRDEGACLLLWAVLSPACSSFPSHCVLVLCVLWFFHLMVFCSTRWSLWIPGLQSLEGGIVLQPDPGCREGSHTGPYQRGAVLERTLQSQCLCLSSVAGSILLTAISCVV